MSEEVETGALLRDPGDTLCTQAGMDADTPRPRRRVSTAPLSTTPAGFRKRSEIDASWSVNETLDPLALHTLWMIRRRAVWREEKNEGACGSRVVGNYGATGNYDLP